MMHTWMRPAAAGSDIPVREYHIRQASRCQVMHPRSVSDYNATEAAEISSARASGGRGRCQPGRAETKYPKAFVIARAVAKYGTNLGFREARAPRRWHTTSHCKNALCSRLKTQRAVRRGRSGATRDSGVAARDSRRDLRTAATPRSAARRPAPATAFCEPTVIQHAHALKVYQ
ncbi:unnamed protein product [Spodoptera exigua]|nr:unnamed protein product [Spodoptera exigua]